MGAIRFIFGLVGLVVMVAVVGLAVFIFTFDFDALKKDISAQASAKYGREIALKGPMKVDFNDGLSLNVKDVTVSSPDGFSNHDFAHIGNLYVFLNWQALLNHAVDIKKVTVDDAQLVLQTNSAGKNNWDFNDPTAKPAPEDKKAIQKQAAEAPSDFRIEKIELKEVELTNTSLTQIAANGKKSVIVLDSAEFKMPGNGALGAKAKGKYNGAAFDFNFDAEKGMQELLGGKATPVHLTATYGGASYGVKGLLAHSEKEVDITNMTATAMGLDATGNLHINIAGAKPGISGNLTIPQLNLMELQKGPVTKAAAVNVEPVGKVQASLIAAGPAPDLSALNAANADIRLTIQKLISSETVTLDNVATQLKLNNGVLQLNDLAFTFLGTPYRGQVEVDGHGAGQVRIALSGTNIDFPAVAHAINAKLPVDAKGDLSMDVRGQGLTPEEITRTLAGKLELAMGKGSFDLGGGDEMAVGLIRFLFPAGTAQKPSMDCLGARFNVANGTFTTNGLVMDTNLATIGGEGSFNPSAQNINMLMRPVAKGAQTASLLQVPVRISGSTAHPSFMPEESAVVQKVTAILQGNRGPVSSGVPQVTPGTGNNACIAALNNPKPIMVTPPTPKEALKETVNTATQGYKNIRDQIKGALNGSTNNAAPATTGTQQPANNNNPAAVINNLKGLFGK